MSASAPAEISVPSWHVFVRQARRHVKHDDGAFAVNVVAIAQATELLLPCCVPAVEADLAPVCGEVKRVDLHTNCCCTPCRLSSRGANLKIAAELFRASMLGMQAQRCRSLGCAALLRKRLWRMASVRVQGCRKDRRTFILLLKVSCQVTLDECCFPCSTAMHRARESAWIDSWRLTRAQSLPAPCHTQRAHHA